MIVKCEWVTCKYNSENVAYRMNNSIYECSGLCECSTGEIFLGGEPECDDCHVEVDAMICESYEHGGNY